jgi:hypothetical protein
VSGRGGARLAWSAVLALALAGCAETGTSTGGRVENARNGSGTMKQAPSNMSTAQSIGGKGRAGEHKTMMHHR